MSESNQSPRKSFDAQLWALHRNSLLFSGLLLILCLPGISVSPDQTVYWLRISGATLPTLRSISAMVAGYAFTAFFLEWLHEVWPFWREQEGQLRTIAEGVNRVADSSSNEIENRRLKMTEAIDALQGARNALEACITQGYIASKVIDTHLRSIINEGRSEQLAHNIYRRLAPAGEEGSLIRGHPPDEVTFRIVRTTVERTLHELTSSGVTAFAIDQGAVAGKINDQLDFVGFELQRSNDAQAAMDLAPLRLMRWTLSGHRVSLVARVWFVALGAPLVLIVAGISRFVWLLSGGH